MVTHEEKMAMLKKSEELGGNVIKFEVDFEGPTGYAISTTEDEQFLIVSVKGNVLKLSPDDAYDIIKQAIFGRPEDYSDLHNDALEIVGINSLYGFIAKNVVFEKYREAMDIDKKTFDVATAQYLFIRLADESLYKGKLIPAITEGKYAGVEDLDDAILRMMIEQLEDRKEFMEKVRKK